MYKYINNKLLYIGILYNGMNIFMCVCFVDVLYFLSLGKTNM